MCIFKLYMYKCVLYVEYYVYKYQKPRVCRYNAGKYILFCDYTTFHLRGVPNQLECKNKAFTFGDYLFSTKLIGYHDFRTCIMTYKKNVYIPTSSFYLVGH